MDEAGPRSHSDVATKAQEMQQSRTASRSSVNGEEDFGIEDASDPPLNRTTNQSARKEAVGHKGKSTEAHTTASRSARQPGKQDGAFRPTKLQGKLSGGLDTCRRLISMLGRSLGRGSGAVLQLVFATFVLFVALRQLRLRRKLSRIANVGWATLKRTASLGKVSYI